MEETTPPPEGQTTPPPAAEISEDMDLDIIDKADKAAQRLENAISSLNKTIDRQHKFMAQMKIEKVLGGKAAATSQKEEESPVEYAKKVMANEAETRP